jgi:PAS domain S-box-containing protein
LQVSRNFKFASVLREGADATNPKPVIEFIASAVGLWLLSLNALVSLVLLPWSSRMAKAQPPREPRQQPRGPIRVLLDSEFQYADMDPEFCELLGRSKSELIGKDAEYVTPIDFCNIHEFRQQVRLTGKEDGYWLYRRKDGALVLVDYSITVRPDNMVDLLVNPAGRKAVREDISVPTMDCKGLARDGDLATNR